MEAVDSHLEPKFTAFGLDHVLVEEPDWSAFGAARAFVAAATVDALHAHDLVRQSPIAARPHPVGLGACDPEDCCCDARTTAYSQPDEPIAVPAEQVA